MGPPLIQIKRRAPTQAQTLTKLCSQSRSLIKRRSLTLEDLLYPRETLAMEVIYFLLLRTLLELKNLEEMGCPNLGVKEMLLPQSMLVRRSTQLLGLLHLLHLTRWH